MHIAYGFVFSWSKHRYSAALLMRKKIFSLAGERLAGEKPSAAI
jgi:hypothetical protein